MPQFSSLPKAPKALQSSHPVNLPHLSLPWVGKVDSPVEENTKGRVAQQIQPFAKAALEQHNKVEKPSLMVGNFPIVCPNDVAKLARLEEALDQLVNDARRLTRKVVPRTWNKDQCHAYAHNVSSLVTPYDSSWRND